MVWIKLDDHFDEHPKFAQAGPLGLALWVSGLAYCNRNLTDGFIPWSIAQRLVCWDFVDPAGPVRVYIGTPTYVSEEGDVTCAYVTELLIGAGLWDEVDGGYHVHDYEIYQPTKAQVEAERAAKITAGRAGGLATAKARATADWQQTASNRSTETPAQSKPVPVPVPVPVPSTSKEALSERARLSDEEQREHLDRLAASLAPGILPTPRVVR